MTVEQLQSYTFNTKYARFNPERHRRETFEESVDRVFGMHERRYSGCGIDAEIAEAKQAVKERLVLGSQRALQFGGTAIETKHARLYNCSVSYADRPRFFQEALWMLLCGCGVGFSVQKHHVAKLPDISRPQSSPLTYVIPDTIEGWADALGMLLSSYFVSDQVFPAAAGRVISFDYSQIRPAGSPISTGAGKAPGPKPLERSLEKIRELLNNRIKQDWNPARLSTVDVYDIVMHASDAVLAGGVRRSATICLFSPDDSNMIKAKTGDWFIKNPQRGRSNNSALLLRETTSFADFCSLMTSVKEFGEPGFVWADSTEIMFNPCAEIGMYPVDVDTGESGWAVCNLCEINMKLCKDVETLTRACRAAAILGTMQAGYTKFEYLGRASERIIEREALLGCSMTGMMDTPGIAFDPEIQRRMASLILEVNSAIAARLGINPSARATCVKPAGSTSCILGTASGIHAHHARRYFRRVQANVSEAPFQYFKAHNPRAVEPSVWNPNGTDAVITFCVEVPEAARTKDTLSATDMLSLVKLTQNNWVAAGRRPERCVAPWLNHNVSNTVTVREHEWETVARYIYDNRDAFAGVSLLPDGGDLDYPQAPFVAVLTFDEISREYGVGSMFASGLIVDGLHAFNNDLWAACDCALGRGKSLELPKLQEVLDDAGLDSLQDRVEKLRAQRDWVRRARKFADNYFNGDVRRMTYCLKRVNNCKLWEDLRREYVNVDYTLLTEDSDQTKLTEAAACAGGKCDII